MPLWERNQNAVLNLKLLGKGGYEKVTKIGSWLLEYFSLSIALLVHQGLVTAKQYGPNVICSCLFTVLLIGTAECDELHNADLERCLTFI